MAQVAHRCSVCQREGHALVASRTFSESGPKWSMSFSCSFCGNQTEADGGQGIPDDIRQALLADEGIWALHVNATGSQKTRAVKVIRSVRAVPVPGAARLLATIPGIPVVGTRTEVEYVKHLLELEGISSRASLD